MRDAILLTGTVLDVHRGDVYTVELDSPERRTIKAVKAGRLHHRHIRITAGDKVTVEMTPYDPTRGRILKRE
jgi:translation initiation factor IF-1